MCFFFFCLFCFFVRDTQAGTRREISLVWFGNARVMRGGVRRDVGEWERAKWKKEIDLWVGGNVSVLPAMHFIPHVEGATRALFLHLWLMLSQTSPHEHLQCFCLPFLASCFCPSLCCLSSLRTSLTHMRCALLESAQCCTSPRNTNLSDEAKSTKCAFFFFFFFSGCALFVTLLFVFSQQHLWHRLFIATTPCDSFTLYCLSPYWLAFTPIFLLSVLSGGSQSVALNWLVLSNSRIRSSRRGNVRVCVQMNRCVYCSVPVCVCVCVCACARVQLGSSKLPPGALASPPKKARICREGHYYNQS